MALDVRHVWEHQQVPEELYMDQAGAGPSSCWLCVVQRMLGTIFTLGRGFAQMHVASVHLEIDFLKVQQADLACVSGRALLRRTCWLRSTADLCCGDLTPGSREPHGQRWVLGCVFVLLESFRASHSCLFLRLPCTSQPEQ